MNPPPRPAATPGKIYLHQPTGQRVYTLLPAADDNWQVVVLPTREVRTVPVTELRSPLESPALVEMVIPDEQGWQYACDCCHGEQEVSVPTAPGSPTSARRRCPRCYGRGLDPAAEVIVESEVGSITMTTPNAYRVGEAADLLGVHPQTMREWADQGTVAAYRVGPRQERRIPATEIDRLRGGQSKAAPAGAGHLVNQLQAPAVSPAPVPAPTPAVVGPPLPALLYYRMDEGTPPAHLETGLARLREAAAQFAAAAPPVEITDVGSGSDAQRPGLLRLFDLVQSRQVSAVVVADLTHLAVAADARAYIQRFCRSFGVPVVVVPPLVGMLDHESSPDGGSHAE